MTEELNPGGACREGSDPAHLRFPEPDCPEGLTAADGTKGDELSESWLCLFKKELVIFITNKIKLKSAVTFIPEVAQGWCMDPGQPASLLVSEVFYRSLLRSPSKISLVAGKLPPRPFMTQFPSTVHACNVVLSFP